eukprot:1528306-Rhodomonas_salina.2
MPVIAQRRMVGAQGSGSRVQGSSFPVLRVEPEGRRGGVGGDLDDFTHRDSRVVGADKQRDRRIAAEGLAPLVQPLVAPAEAIRAMVVRDQPLEVVDHVRVLVPRPREIRRQVWQRPNPHRRSAVSVSPLHHILWHHVCGPPLRRCPGLVEVQRSEEGPILVSHEVLEGRVEPVVNVVGQVAHHLGVGRLAHRRADVEERALAHVIGVPEGEAGQLRHGVVGAAARDVAGPVAVDALHRHLAAHVVQERPARVGAHDHLVAQRLRRDEVVEVGGEALVQRHKRRSQAAQRRRVRVLVRLELLDDVAVDALDHARPRVPRRQVDLVRVLAVQRILPRRRHNLDHLRPLRQRRVR